MINPEELKELIDNYSNLVRAKRSERYPELRIVKYRPNVFYDNLWNEHPLLVECRGLVIDDNYNVIVKPLTKIFNRFENGTDINQDEVCTIVEKINGFMGVVTGWRGKNLVSTTGSLDSKYALLAEEYLKNILVLDGESLTFEIVDPSDPHIIKEKPGCYLLAANNTRGHYWASQEDLDYRIKFRNKIYGKFFRPKWQENTKFSDAVKLAKLAKHEGYVVYGSSGTTLKLKSPYYLTTKLFARMKGEKLIRLLKNKAPFRVDEDYLPVVEYLRRNIDEFVQFDEQQKVQHVRKFIEKEILN